MADRIKDMTKGKPAGLIITFALPLMLGNVFQQLYTMVDTIIVGRVVGVEALAALGAADWLNWLLLGLIIGFTQGFSLLVSQRFGAEDFEGLKKTIAMSVLLSGVIAVVMTAIGLLFAMPTLRMLNTPENIIGMSHLYLTVLFSGIGAVTAYNIVSSILRAMGDSKTPLIAMIIAAGINIVLDILFVAGFSWGVAGAAVATVIAQLFSFFYCFNAMRRIPILKLHKHHWKPEKGLVWSLLKIGSPMALQNAIIGGGGLVVQYVINGFGFIYVAGFTATNKLYGLLELASISFGFSMATFAGQNLGAKKYKRINRGMNSALKMTIGTALVVSAAMIVFGRNILMQFISGTPQEIEAVLNVSYKYLVVMCSALFVLYLLHIYRSALQGLGDTVIPMVSGIVELIARISVILFLPLLIGEAGLYFAEVAAWLGAALVLMTAYYIRIGELIKRQDGIDDTLLKTETIRGEITDAAY